MPGRRFNEESATEQRIAYRTDFKPGVAWYVCSVPEKQPSGRYCDWGYTDNVEKALPLSPYWQRRFRKDTERVGHKPHFLHTAIANNDEPRLS